MDANIGMGFDSGVIVGLLSQSYFFMTGELGVTRRTGEALLGIPLSGKSFELGGENYEFKKKNLDRIGSAQDLVWLLKLILAMSIVVCLSDGLLKVLAITLITWWVYSATRSISATSPCQQPCNSVESIELQLKVSLKKQLPHSLSLTFLPTTPAMNFVCYQPASCNTETRSGTQ